MYVHVRAQVLLGVTLTHYLMVYMSTFREEPVQLASAAIS